MTSSVRVRGKTHKKNIIAVGPGWTFEAAFVAASVLFCSQHLFWLPATLVIGEVKHTPKHQFTNLLLCFARSSGSLKTNRRLFYIRKSSCFRVFVCFLTKGLTDRFKTGCKDDYLKKKKLFCARFLRSIIVGRLCFHLVTSQSLNWREALQV